MTASYVYDVNGLRTSKTVNGTTTNFINDNGSVIASITGETVTQFFRGADIGWMRVGDEKPVFYHYNLHGDTSKLTDTALKTVADYDYDAFGNVTAETASVDNPFRYCGEYLDNETGLIYLRARYYAPSIGAFVSEDPHWDTDNMIYGDERKINGFAINNEHDKKEISGTKILTEYNDLNCYIIFSSIEKIQIVENEEDGNLIYLPHILSIQQNNNLYVYCINNPVNNIDLSGENTIAIGAGMGAKIGAIAGPAGVAVGVAVGVATGANITVAVVDKVTVYYEAEHTSGARKSTKDKHQNGQTRKKRDKGGEKGDSRRPVDRSNKKRK